MSTAPLSAGFVDPVRDAQAAFRALLDATARPGTLAALPAPAEPPPAPLDPAAASVALALCDADTPVYLADALASGGVPDWLRFHCGCRIVADAAEAAFAFAAGRLPDALGTGSDLYPDQSATLVLQVAALGRGAALLLSGPGIDGTQAVRVAGLPDGFVAARAANRALYPRGIDLILVAGHQVLCLPRSTAVEAG
jgi:alpha-D-ribose 1-methylphosphonate 5-triphosphate synthase subunit PhnH